MNEASLPPPTSKDQQEEDIPLYQELKTISMPHCASTDAMSLIHGSSSASGDDAVLDLSTTPARSTFAPVATPVLNRMTETFPARTEPGPDRSYLKYGRSPPGARTFCHVCHQPTSKHIFYGGQVCESCRGFFRRSVRAKWDPLSRPCDNESNNDGNNKPCEIDSKRRRGCAKCRYRRCLDAGMRPELVNNNSIVDMNKPASPPAASASSSPPPIVPLAMSRGNPEISWTLDEELKVRYIVKKNKQASFDALSQSLPADPLPIKAFEAMMSSGQQIKPEMKKQLNDSIEGLFVKSVVASSAKLMPAEEAKAMAEKTFPVFHSLATVTYFGRPWLKHYISEYVEHVRLKNASDPVLESLARTFEKVDMGVASSVRNYELFYKSPWHKSLELEEEHKRLTFNMREWMRPRGGEAFDEILLHLVLLCSLYHNSQRDSVQATRHKLLKLLNRYLQHTYGGDKAWELLGYSLGFEEKAHRVYELHSEILSA